MHIRPATTADLPRIMEIAVHAGTAPNWTQSQYQEAFSSGRLAIVVVECSTVLGFLIGREVASEWEIENVVITETARRRGLGSRLLGEFLHHVRSSGGDKVFLEVRESNHAARKLYEKWAFTQVGRRKDYYSNPLEDALILKFYFSSQS